MIERTDKHIIIDGHKFTRAEAVKLMEIIERNLLDEL